MYKGKGGAVWLLHADGSAEVVFSPAFVCLCLSVCLSGRYLKNRCSTKLDTQMFQDESLKSVYFGVKRSKIKTTKTVPVYGSLHSCKCWLLLVGLMLSQAVSEKLCDVSLCLKTLSTVVVLTFSARTPGCSLITVRRWSTLHYPGLANVL